VCSDDTARLRELFISIVQAIVYMYSLAKVNSEEGFVEKLVT